VGEKRKRKKKEEEEERKGGTEGGRERKIKIASKTTKSS
jgi:hypothetical protein